MSSRKEEKEAARQDRLAKETELAAKQRRERKLKLGAAVAAIVLCAFALLVFVVLAPPNPSSDAADLKAVHTMLASVPQHGMELGNPKAAVHVDEYGDLQCPVCRMFTLDALPTIVRGPISHGSLSWTFHNWTIIDQTQSVTAAEASLAAAKQGRAWQFIDYFYHRQQEERSGYITPSFLNSIASGAGLNLKQFNRDRQNPEYQAETAANANYAQKHAFVGTPSFAIHGPKGTKYISGQLPTAQQFDQALNAVS